MASTFRRKIRNSIRERGLLGTLKISARKVAFAYRDLTAERETLNDVAEFDKEFNVDTNWTKLNPLTQIAMYFLLDGAAYGPTPPGVVREVLVDLPIRYEDFTFIDFGSGKGPVILTAAEFPFKQIVGVELFNELHRVAEKNISTYKNPAQKCRNLKSICVNAVDYELPEDPIVAFFFCPFYPEALTSVLENFRQSLLDQPRDTFLIYSGDLWLDILKQTEFLVELKTAERYRVFRVDLAKVNGNPLTA